MKFIEFNINPKNKRTKDCVIRAIATATNSSWEYIYRELAELGIKKGLMINVESYNRYSMSPQRTKLKEKLEEDIKQNFINYINNINSNWKTELFDYKKIIPYKDIIFRNIDVSLRDLIFDRSWNREVVFYFCSINKYLVL